MTTTMKSSGEHRRGRSMGSYAARAGEKDEDLALFHEMKRREKHNFLHPSPDDLDATLSSKFGGMGAPVKKVANELLASESDKNDYDWLLTPPGTPLFPSLDQEAAALVVQLSPALSNGSYSSASSATKSMKSSHSPAESVSKGSRGNPSPRRSGSAGSTPNGISRSRSSPTSAAAILTRPSTPTSTGARPSTPTTKSSVRASTPNLKLTISNSSKNFSSAGTTPTGGTRPSTPTARSSTPPVRPSTPVGRSSTPTSKPSTPTMRRSLSGGRTGLTSPSTTRGAPSPKRTTSSSRGNSPSAKRVTAVITSVAGMSSEVPPNLRTSVPERPTSSGNGSRDNGDDAQNRRRPRSPSVARSFSSSSSQDQRTSSQTSRGSVISSYDDGLEVNRPSMVSNRNSSAGKWHAAAQEELLNAKTSTFVKRVARSSVGPKETSPGGYGGTPTKKSSDHMKRPVDAYQNSPTSAYRHLHSSSPGSPFYSTRSNSMLLRPGSAMNSSVTTSSNASSEHGTTVAPDTEGSERDEDDLLSWDSYGRRASSSPRVHADILVLDKDDEKIGSWPDSLYERPHSHDPSQTPESQSTVDTEVASFYETDGIASLEMLEQLGVMGGESYKLRKSSTFGARSSIRRVGSAENSKIPTPRLDSGHLKNAHRLFQEAQSLPGPHGAKLQRQESLESLRRSRNFEMELLKRNGEMALGLPESKPPNSEIRAACLFVRDFKVGPAPPHTQEASASADDSSPGLSLLGIGEIERKLRNDLSHDWDNSLDLEDAIEDIAVNKIVSKLSDSPILVSQPNGEVASLGPLSLEDPFRSGAAAYDLQNNVSVLTSTLSEHVRPTEMRDPEPTMVGVVDQEYPISLDDLSTSAEMDTLYVLDGMMDDIMMDESETESRDDLFSSLAPEYLPSGAMAKSLFVHQTVVNDDIMMDESETESRDELYSSIAPDYLSFSAIARSLLADKTVKEERLLSTSQRPGSQCDAGEDRSSVMDAVSPAAALVVHGSEGEEEQGLLEPAGEQVHLKVLQDLTPMDLDTSCSSSAENTEAGAGECLDSRKPSERETQQRAAHPALLADEETLQELADEEFQKLEFLKVEKEEQIADTDLELEEFTEREKLPEVTEVRFEQVQILDGVNEEDLELEEDQVSDGDNLQEFSEAGFEPTPFLDGDNQDENEELLMMTLCQGEYQQEVAATELELRFIDSINELRCPAEKMHFSESETWPEHGIRHILEGESQQEVAHARLDAKQFPEGDDEPDVAQISEGETRQEVPHGALKVVQLSGRQDLNTDVPFGGLEVLKLFSKEDQQEVTVNAVADGRLNVVHFSEGECEQEDFAEGLISGKDGHHDVPFSGADLYNSERESDHVQNVHANGNFKADSEYAIAPKTNSSPPHHTGESHGELAVEAQCQEFWAHSAKSYGLAVREMPEISSLYNGTKKSRRESPLHPLFATGGADDVSNCTRKSGQESPLHPLFATGGADDVSSGTRKSERESPPHPFATGGAEDTESIKKNAVMSAVVSEGIQDSEAETTEISIAKGALDEFGQSFSSLDKHQVQEESQSLEYFEADYVGPNDVDDEEVSSVSHHAQEDSDSLNFCNSDSAMEFEYLQEVQKEVRNVFQTTPNSIFTQVSEDPLNEDCTSFRKSHPEHLSLSFGNQQMSGETVDCIKLHHDVQKVKPEAFLADMDTNTIKADPKAEYFSSNALDSKVQILEAVLKLDCAAALIGKQTDVLDLIPKVEDSCTTVEGEQTIVLDLVPKSADSVSHLVTQQPGGLDVLQLEGPLAGPQTGMPESEHAVAHVLGNLNVLDLASKLENSLADSLTKQAVSESLKLEDSVVHVLREKTGVLEAPEFKDSIAQHTQELEDPMSKDYGDHIGKETGLVNLASKSEDSVAHNFDKDLGVLDPTLMLEDSGDHFLDDEAEFDLGPRPEVSSDLVPESQADGLEQVSKLEDRSGLSPPKIEFRSASTLCAALEMQIAGLIQKIDSAIEESSKPFNSCQQEGVLPKEEHNTFSSSELARELEQDDCTASIRSSHEEDLLDMLWAEDDGGAIFSEGSRDQDLSNSKDGSQREMNSGRSSRLSDRGLTSSPLGQPGETYEAVVRSSLSDLGVEKHQVVDQFKKSAVGLLNDYDDGMQNEMGVRSARFSDGGVLVAPHPQQNEVGSFKHQMLEPLKKSAMQLANQTDDDKLFTASPEERSLLKSLDRDAKASGGEDAVTEGLHCNPEAMPEIRNSSIPHMAVGAQPKQDEALHIASHEQESDSDNMTQSTCNQGDDMKSDEELFSVGSSAEQADLENVSGVLASRQEKDSGMGDLLVKKLPINKAKSVRTLSLSTVPQIESSTEDCGSPNGVQMHKFNGYADVTVISPETLQWDQSLLVDEMGTKTKSSPGTLSRSLTLAEAADTILYCSSLMHTIVYKAAAYAIEKEELAALASSPTSNGETLLYPGLPETDQKDQNDSVEGEKAQLKGQRVTTTATPARRALSYMGQQTLPSAPADTSLQIPEDQVIEKEGRSLETVGHIAIPVYQKEELPVKPVKSKCGCTIM